MKATKTLLFALLAAALMTSVARADSFKAPALSGTVFAYYRHDLTSKEESSQEGANEFEVSRVYFNVIGAVAEKFHYRVTADVGREEVYKYNLEYDPGTGVYTLVETKSLGRLDFFAKYAYVDVRDVIPNHNIYGGIEKTPWAPYENGIWGWRVIRRVAYHDRGYGTTADLGVGVAGGFAEGLVKHHLTFTNGAGFKKAEDGLSGKAVAYRLSVFPLVADDAWKGLSLNAVVKGDNLGEKVAEGEEKNAVTVYGGLLGLQHEFANVGVGYFARSAGAGDNKVDGNVVTAYATGHWRATEGMTVHPLARYDMFEPDTGEDDDERTLLIGGVGFKFFDDKLALIPNYQAESYKVFNEQTQAAEDKSIDYVYLHCQWDWQ